MDFLKSNLTEGIEKLIFSNFQFLIKIPVMLENFQDLHCHNHMRAKTIFTCKGGKPKKSLRKR